MSSSKQHQPTTRRLRELREKGKSVKCQSFTRLVAPILVCNIFVTTLCSPWLAPWKLLESLLFKGFSDPLASLREAGVLLIAAVLCFLTPCSALGYLIESVQSPRLFQPAWTLPKMSRLSGGSKIASGLKEIWMLLFKAATLFLVFLWFFTSSLQKFRGLPLAEAGAQLYQFSDLLSVFFVTTLMTGAAFGLGEYLYRRWEFYRSARMSAEELRREHREMDGDPLLKAVRKGLHEALSMSNLVKAVRRSKVIIVERNG